MLCPRCRWGVVIELCRRVGRIEAKQRGFSTSRSFHMMTKSRRVGPGPRRNRSARLEFLELEERRVMSLLGQSLFPADNAWNQKITAAPVAANSGAILNNITTVY